MRMVVREAVVLAGGEGTRLRPLTDTRPKPLLPVLGRPCIGYALESLAKAGVERVYIACGYKAMDLVTALGDGSDLDVELVFAFEEEPAGTAGAVKLLEEVLGETFIVASGDVLADVDMAGLVDFHARNGAVATMALTEVDRPEQFGIVGLDGNGRIERFKEKPSSQEVFSHLINAGIYVLEREVLDRIPDGMMFDFSKNLFPLLLGEGRPLFGAPLSGMWKDIGRPEDLLDANLLMVGRRGEPLTLRGVTASGIISGSPPLAPDSVLAGPLHFGPGVRLGRGSRISSSVLGAMVEVGEGARMQRSLLLDRCVIGDRCLVSDSVLGEGCLIHEGARLTRSVLGDGAIVGEGERLVDARIE